MNSPQQVGASASPVRPSGRSGPTHILGLSAFYHDSAACLVRDGEIVAAAQEERFTRKKGDASFPEHAVAFCLRQAGIEAKDLQLVAFYDKPLLKFERILETYLGIAPRGFRSFLKAGPLWIKEKLFIDRELRRRLDWEGDIAYAEHHESHAASAFYPSPFEEAAILTIDGVGEWATASIGMGRGSAIEILSELQWPDSLGLLYSAFTYYTGFKVNSGEYKVMGLAPYGEPKYVDRIYSELIDLREDGSFRLNQEYFDFLGGLTMTSKKFDALFGGPPRHPESRLTQREMDLARSIQDVCEEIMLRMVRTAHRDTGARSLCLAGGVALNCVGNGRVLREGPFERLWIQPAAGDAGGALGVAMLSWHRHFGAPRHIAAPAASAVAAAAHAGERTHALASAGAGVSGGDSYGDEPAGADAGGETMTTGAASSRVAARDAMRGAYLGPSYSPAEIEAFLASTGARGHRMERAALIDETARLLADGNVIGWFAGRMEFGPRALGGRSILGDPRNPAMQRTMNLKIKFRESFRPFAPSVLRERVGDYFEMDEDSPYMLLVAPVRPERRCPPAAGDCELWGIERLNQPRSDIPAVTHVDYSARIQTVSREDNPEYHDLIHAFERRTGCAVLVNTSFNVRGEPIVCTPMDAYRCFMRTNIDYLVLWPFLLAKSEQPEWHEEGEDWRTAIPLD
ncbi:MAG TPA: carbamoyltransferase [Gemmatimonadaceae bacterium]|nr:carbamoyltransferase [Gemmatimonadaceae bacterium]